MRISLTFFRRYRFGDPKSTRAKYRVYGQLLKFFIAWNGIGYLFFRFMKKKGREIDPDFDSKSSGMQIASLMGHREMAVKYTVKYDKEKGFHVDKSEENVKITDDTTSVES